MQIIENTTQFSLNTWENYGKQRVYIEKKLGVLGQDLYFDVDEMAVFVKSNRQRVSAWTCEQVADDTAKVISNTSHDYFIVKF